MGNSTEKSVASEAVIKIAERINKLLITAFLLAIAAVITKLTAGSTMKIPSTDIAIPITYFWIVFAVFTGAHAYLAIFFKGACGHLFYKDHKNAMNTWEKLTRNGPIFFNGMRPRLLPDLPPATKNATRAVAPMAVNDGTTWLHYGMAILLFFAILPFDPITFGLGVALILVLLNWFLGSSWAIAVSELTLEEGKAKYLRRPKPDA